MAERKYFGKLGEVIEMPPLIEMFPIFSAYDLPNPSGFSITSPFRLPLPERGRRSAESSLTSVLVILGPTVSTAFFTKEFSDRKR